MPKFIDLTGLRFERLLVVRRVATSAAGKTQWLCLCDCSAEMIAMPGALISGHTRSCGCLQREVVAAKLTTHAHTKKGAMSPTYTSWKAMRRRCMSPTAAGYAQYGGRGIAVCERWRGSFENFLADMGERPPGTSIERIDNNGSYEPSNCRWATPRQQASNRRPDSKTVLITFGGETLSISDWQRRTGIDARKIGWRYAKGWPIERVFA